MPIGCFHQNRLHEQIGINHGTVCEKQNLYSDEHCHHGKSKTSIRTSTATMAALGKAAKETDQSAPAAQVTHQAKGSQVSLVLFPI